MEKLKFGFTVKSAEDQKTNIIATSITTMTGNIYIIPTEHQPMKFHMQLAETEVFKKVKNTLQRRNQKRNVWITLSEDLKKLYLDQEGNMCFKDYLLEELEETQPIGPATTTTGISEESLKQLLEKFTKIETQETKEDNLKKISEKFIIEKFREKCQCRSMGGNI